MSKRAIKKSEAAGSKRRKIELQRKLRRLRPLLRRAHWVGTVEV